MHILYSIIAGIVGTFLMTLFTRFASKLTGYSLHVPTILGSMFMMKVEPSGKPSRSTASLFAGYLIHYLIGIIFAMLYVQILYPVQNLSSYTIALIFGVVAGFCAVLFWFAFIKLHPLAPNVKLNLYLFIIFLGHLVFALAMNAAFQTIRLLSPNL